MQEIIMYTYMYIAPVVRHPAFVLTFSRRFLSLYVGCEAGLLCYPPRL